MRTLHIFTVYLICIINTIFPSEITSNSHADPLSLSLCARGFAHLIDAAPSINVKFKQEVDDEKVTIGMQCLLNALKEEEQENPVTKVVARNIIDFFLLGEMPQFLLMHGYVDTLFNSMPHNGPADFNLKTPSFDDKRESGVLPCNSYVFSLGLHKASPFPVLQHRLTCTVPTDIGKKLVRLSPDHRTLTCITTTGFAKSAKETVNTYAIDADRFHALCVGTKRYALVHRDTNHKMNITLKGSTFADITIIQTPYDTPIDVLLSPDEWKILCKPEPWHDAGYRVYDFSTRQWHSLCIFQSDCRWLPSHEMVWNKENTCIAVYSSDRHRTFTWNIPHHEPRIILIDNTTALKMALYDNWLAALKRDCAQEINMHTIYALRRMNTMPWPKKLPPDYVKMKKKEWHTFLFENGAKEVVEQ
ncbi:MAG: hypothetical protein WCE21_01695 [Candidatus Babeliales bacterium]